MQRMFVCDEFRKIVMDEQWKSGSGREKIHLNQQNICVLINKYKEKIT